MQLYGHYCCTTNAAFKNCNSFVPLGFASLSACSIALGRIYEVWLLPLHAPAVRIPACSWCGWRPTGHASLTPPQPAASLPQPHDQPLISEQGDGPVVMTGALVGAHWRLRCKEKLERIILWGGHRDLSWGIRDLMVQGVPLECSGSGFSLRLERRNQLDEQSCGILLIKKVLHSRGI